MPIIGVTGATGFVGRALVKRLCARADGPDCLRIRLLVRNPHRRKLPESFASEPVEVVDGDLDQPAALTRLVDGCSQVIHVAAAIGGNHRQDFDRTNVVGTRRLLDAMQHSASDAQLVLVSSLAARRPDLSWYAASKRAAEELVRVRWPQHWILRPPAVYGPDDPALADFWKLLARGWLIRLGPAEARFSMLHVDDLTALIDRLLDPAAIAPGIGRILEPRGPEPERGWTWSALAAVAAAVRGAPVRQVAVPVGLLRTIGAVGLLLGRLRGRPALINPGKVRELQHLDWVCDNLRSLPGWRPTRTLDQALPELPGWRTR